MLLVALVASRHSSDIPTGVTLVLVLESKSLGVGRFPVLGCNKDCLFFIQSFLKLLYIFYTPYFLPLALTVLPPSILEQI